MRPVLFRIGAVLLPLAVILGVELVWQLAAPERLFIELPGQPEYQIVNPEYATRYFSGFKPQAAFNPFLKEKPAGGTRIVALGGSSTAGFPYHFYHAFPERLAAELRAAHPLRTIEVVNLGMTAVNSHMIRDIIPAVARINPDAVVIYAGHNEYYGALGAGTGAPLLRNNLWTKRALLWLKRSKLFGALEGLLSSADQSDRTMMARSVGDAHIALNEAAYYAGIDQFAANMGNTLRHFRKEGIPVYMGTVVSNLEGQPPLGQDSLAEMTFAKAREYMEAGDTTNARAAFVQARELDPVRFRAPAAINETIRNLALAEGAHLVELESHFEGLGHDTLFTDHLHPTAAGHALIASAFSETLGHQLMPSSAIPDLDPSPDRFEQAHADLHISRLKGGFPFTRGQTPEQEWTLFTGHLERALNSGSYADSLAAAFVDLKIQLPEALLTASNLAQAQGDTLEALRFMRALMHWQPFNESVHRTAVTLAGQIDVDLALAGEVVQLAAHYSQETDILNTLAAIRIRQGHLPAAATILREVEFRNANSPVMLFNMARLLILQGDTLTARVYFERFQTAQASP